MCEEEEDKLQDRARMFDRDSSFEHIKEWSSNFDVSPCCRTEIIYLPSFRSEEPVASNMDISTGHIVLVSRRFIG